MISFVCGQLCSGKTAYSKALASISRGVYIEVGDIVRSLLATDNRRVLQDSQTLDQTIVSKLKEEVLNNQYSDLIISGVRQKSILESFKDATLLWIECPKSIRQDRYIKRARTGDKQTFEEAEAGDINLGILEVKQYILERNE